MDHRIDHMLDTGGRTLSEADRQFVTLLFRELEQFQYQAPKDRALMFHPLRGYERYLIHKVTEVFPKLTSFSIGDEKNRRTVVCFKSKRKEQQMQLGQLSPEKRPPSRGSAKEPKNVRGKSKTLDSSPAKNRRRSTDPTNRNKQGRYNTWDGEAVRKRERGLNVEGPVVNGDREHPKSDAEAIKREPRNPGEAKKKYRSRRSRSQPQLNERHRPKHQSDHYDDSSDHHVSDDLDSLARKPRRLSSGAFTLDKQSRGSKPVNVNGLVDETLRRGVEEIHTSSGTDFSGRDAHSAHSDVENNEIPPSYDKMSDSSVKSKAKRNMRRIKRTNSTKSCPPMNDPKHDYVNSEAIVNAEKHHEESPVFPRRGKSNLSDAESRHSERHSKSVSDDKKRSPRKSKKDKPSKSRDKVPGEDDARRDSYESSPFDSFSPEMSEPIKETVAIVESVPKETASNADSLNLEAGIHGDDVTPNKVHKVEEKPTRLSDQIPLAAAEAMMISTPEKFDKETQTELRGSVIDAMMSTYNAHLDAFGQLAPQNLQTPQPGSTIPPSSLRTSGTSTPTLSSPVSTYEKLGEYMYKAMLNFQNMLIGGHGMPQPHEFMRSSNGRTAFSPPTALYAPVAPAAPPLYMPWMGPYYPDPIGTRPPIVPYSPQSSAAGDSCCPVHLRAHKEVNKMNPRLQGSFKKHRKEPYRATPPHDDPIHWNGNHTANRYRHSIDRTPSSAEHSMSAHLSRSAKALDGSESDVSSEITNPEVTVAEGGDGVMVYVRNASNRSNSSVGGSASSLHGPNIDNIPRASPLGHDDDDNVFKKGSNSSSGNQKKKRNLNEPAQTGPTKRNEKSSPEKSEEDKTPHNDDPNYSNALGITSEEVVLSLQTAPLATMDDDDIDGSGSASYTSSHSGHHEKISRTPETPHADSARSLIGEDLTPLVCFDDNLEIACQDGSAED